MGRKFGGGALCVFAFKLLDSHPHEGGGHPGKPLLGLGYRFGR